MAGKKPTKYLYVKVLQGNYGYGWDDLVFYDADTPVSERRADLKAYRENQRGRYRIIDRRIPNSKYRGKK